MCLLTIHNDSSAKVKPPCEAELLGINEISLFENALAEIVIKTTCSCEHVMANVDPITVIPYGRYAGGSHISLSLSHITHSESSLRPMPWRRIWVSPIGRDSDSFPELSAGPVSVWIHVINGVCKSIDSNTYLYPSI